MEDDGPRCGNINIILLGDMGVGKTSILMRFRDDKFSPTHIATIGIDYQTRKFRSFKNNIFSVHLWDTVGQERFRSIGHDYIKKADIILLCFDTTNTESFTNLRRWLGDIKKISKDHVITMIVGLKIDQISDRKISCKDGEEFAHSKKLKYREISAKTFSFTQIKDTIFQSLINKYQKLCDKYPDKIKQSKSSRIVLSESTSKCNC
jgi:small GTP-binding protein